jgi:hypothetical protein
MRSIITWVLVLVPFYVTLAQQNIYLKKSSNGHLKKLRSKTILTFKLSDSTLVKGRIIAVTDSSFRVSTYRQQTKTDTVDIVIKSVRQVTNELINKSGLAETAGWVMIGAGLGVIMIPVAWIDDGPDAALDGVEFVGVLLGTSAVLLSPYLIQRKYDLTKKWTMVVN